MNAYLRIAIVIAITIALFYGFKFVNSKQQNGGFAFITNGPTEGLPGCTLDGAPNREGPRIPFLSNIPRSHVYQGFGIPLPHEDREMGPFDLPPFHIAHNMNPEVVLNTPGLPFSTDRGAIAVNSEAIEDYFKKTK